MPIIVQQLNERTKSWEIRNALRTENMALVGGQLSYNAVVHTARQYLIGWNNDTHNSGKQIRVYDTDRKVSL